MLSFFPIFVAFSALVSGAQIVVDAFQTTCFKGTVVAVPSLTERPQFRGQTSMAISGRDDTNEDIVLYSDDSEGTSSSRKTSRWNSLSPNIKKKIIEESQQRAVRNKQKREPAADKKRRKFVRKEENSQENMVSLHYALC